MFRADGNWPAGLRLDLLRSDFHDLEVRAAVIMTDTTGMCSMDPTLGVVIHRFDTGAYTCRCGQSVNPDPDTVRKETYNRMHPRRKQKVD